MKQLNITDVRALPGDSAFLIDDGTTAILYDSGFAFTGDRVAQNIKNVLGDRPLDYVFLTHSHYDHALGSVYALKHWPAAQVVAGEYATKIFAKPTAKAVMRDLDRKFATACGVAQYEDLIDGLKVDIPVAEGNVIRAGEMTFVAVDLPGHTKCSVGYYCPEYKLLLGSETIGVYNGEDDVVPAYLVGYRMALDSMKKLEALDIAAILVPHFGVLEGERASFYLQKGRESAVTTAENIAEQLKNGTPKEAIADAFIRKIYRGYVREIYPVDAMKLNTGIMIDLLEKELL